MKKLIVIFGILLSMGCNEPKKERVYTVEEQIMIDSIANSLQQQAVERVREDAKTTDTIGVYKAPIKVIKAAIVSSASGDYRNVQLKYQNVSNQNIVAIKFRWKGENAFFEPADMGNSFLKGYGGGFSDDLIKPNQIEYATWEILSRNAKTIEAWPIEVVFEDKTKWELDNQ